MIAGGQIVTTSGNNRDKKGCGEDIGKNPTMPKVPLKACALAHGKWKTCLECQFSFCVKEEKKPEA